MLEVSVFLDTPRGRMRVGRCNEVVRIYSGNLKNKKIFAIVKLNWHKRNKESFAL